MANIALHGLETDLKAAFPPSIVRDGQRLQHWQPTLIRYADDFVVLHSDKAVIEQAKQFIMTWLTPMGLELKASKTHITHTLNADEGQVGFDFLGFTIRQFAVGKTQAGKMGNNLPIRLGFKTLIRPSKEAIRRHLRKTKTVIKAHVAGTQTDLIDALNPVIRGWANYFSTSCAKRLFNKVDHLTFAQLYAWANRRHPQQSTTWVVAKYWQPTGTRKWVFATSHGTTLLRHADTPIHRHTKVRGTRSPFDGDWLYWATRLGRHPQLAKRTALLLKRQQGCCARCGLFFTTEDLLEVDHILPRSQGGQDTLRNWQLLHRHCHDQKTASDLDAAPIGIRDQNHSFEEPCDGKPSCTVLKTSRAGDCLA